MFRKLRFRFLLFALLAFLWWLLSRQDQEQAQPPMEVEIIVPADEPKATPVTAHKAMPPKKVDNLQKITGIGPKISSVLQAAGITTYAKLADTDLSELQNILHEAGVSRANPETWPEQARHAVSGEGVNA